MAARTRVLSLALLAGVLLSSPSGAGAAGPQPPRTATGQPVMNAAQLAQALHSRSSRAFASAVPVLAQNFANATGVVPSFNSGTSPIIGTVPVTGTLFNTTTGVVSSYTWDFGDGTSVTVPDRRSVTHTWTVPNIYNVTLTATDSTGKTYVASQVNNVYARPPSGTYFQDVTPSSGTAVTDTINVQNQMGALGAGIAWCDVNNDGYQDLFVSVNGGPNKLFMNSGPPSYTFHDEAAARGVDDPLGMHSGVVCVDYDNDGYKDLYVLNFSPSWAPTLPKSRLFHNDGSGHFTDVAHQAGLDVGQNGQASAWGDYDGDGLLDVYIVNHSDQACPICPPTPGGSEDHLFHQNPDHTFTDVTQYLQPNLSAQGTGFQATWTDFDGDGRLDLYVANDRFVKNNPMNRNVMWHNGGPGCGGWCFTDIATTNGTGISVADMGMLVADVNNDGLWDMYASNFGGNVLLGGLPGTRWGNVTKRAQVGHPMLGARQSDTWGMAAIDYDNDKYLDIYLVSGYLGPLSTHYETLQAYLQPNVLFHNRGGAQAGVFDDVSVFSGVDNELKGRSAAYADYNQDGAVDLYLENFGEACFLYQNTLHGNNWVQLELQGNGTTSPRDPAGAIVKVTTSDGVTQMRNVQVGTGLGNGHDLALYFGLGKSTSISTLTITWPDHQVNTYSNVTTINGRWKIIQSATPGAAPQWVQEFRR